MKTLLSMDLFPAYRGEGEMGEVRSGDVILGVALVGVSLGVGEGEGGGVGVPMPRKSRRRTHV